jgi:hypothetical protein
LGDGLGGSQSARGICELASHALLQQQPRARSTVVWREEQVNMMEIEQQQYSEIVAARHRELAVDWEA